MQMYAASLEADALGVAELLYMSSVGLAALVNAGSLVLAGGLGSGALQLRAIMCRVGGLHVLRTMLLSDKSSSGAVTGGHRPCFEPNGRLTDGWWGSARKCPRDSFREQTPIARQQLHGEMKKKPK